METKQCAGCKKMFDITSFAVSRRAIDNGKRIGKCGPCNEKFKGYIKKYRGTAKGNVVVNQIAKKARSTPHGKAMKKKLSQTPIAKATRKRYMRSEIGKANAKRQRQSPVGKAQYKRALEAARLLYANDPSYRMQHMVHSSSVRILNGTLQTSPSFENRTGRGCAEFAADIHAKAVAKGFVVANRGSWSIDHVIPQHAFDFCNPEDVRRCWSKENLDVASPLENDQKSWHIVDELCEAVGADKYPVAWCGRLPSEEKKQEMYTRLQNRLNAIVAESDEDSNE
ncbi:MAG: hypothetical protein CMI16_14090 [Opitutaceae bacterium]|nr:hypothetical protein [Opitutaceae bacterium]|tara:strand:+ start:319 stop:1164 length:846 start_codon:yes stop_codon:yes gene_type:complete